MYNLTLKQEKGPFFSVPSSVELPGDKIALNNVILPRHIDKENSFNPHNVKLYAIGHEFGAICAVWASNQQDALDEACDLGLLDCFLYEDQSPENYESGDFVALGNAGELFDLQHAWLGVVEFDAGRDTQLIVDTIRASENQKSFIGE